MKGETRQLDPQIAELVREAVRDEGARLFAAPRLEDVPGLAALREPTRPSATGLPKAERHLLQTYREEAAWLLREAAALACLSRSDQRILRHVDVTTRVDPPARPELARASRNVLDHGRTAVEDAECVQALEGLLEGDAQPLAPAARLATFSLRLVPTDEARLCLHVALRQDELEEPAAAIARDLIEHLPTALNASIAWCNIGAAALHSGALVEARDAFCRAAQHSPNPFAMLSWVSTACQLGDQEDALRASATLDDRLACDHPAIDEYASYRRLERFQPTKAYTDTTRSLLERFGPASRRALDV